MRPGEVITSWASLRAVEAIQLKVPSPPQAMITGMLEMDTLLPLAHGVAAASCPPPPSSLLDPTTPLPPSSVACELDISRPLDELR